MTPVITASFTSATIILIPVIMTALITSMIIVILAAVTITTSIIAACAIERSTSIILVTLIFLTTPVISAVVILPHFTPFSETVLVTSSSIPFFTPVILLSSLLAEIARRNIQQLCQQSYNICSTLASACTTLLWQLGRQRRVTFEALRVVSHQFQDLLELLALTLRDFHQGLQWCIAFIIFASWKVSFQAVLCSEVTTCHCALI
mmetsp:Transcript_68238/g.149968  ORF Transcript_68238/g.149968 Transcript_68238/m.149968 type:complete len:205 (-) Transcript_68238:206-820(-)